MSYKTVAWVLLTMDRSEHVEQSLKHNIANAGMDCTEFIHVDNGSTEDLLGLVSSHIKPTAQLKFSGNTGVARGYNTAMSLARSDLIIITGCDTIMPANWLKTSFDAFNTIDNLGVLSIYCAPLDKVKERVRSTIFVESGLKVVKGLPFGRRMVPRWILNKIGYFYEGFPKYGWEDNDWGSRAINYCDTAGLKYYALVDYVAQHLKHSVPEPEHYLAFKEECIKRGKIVINNRQKRGFPYFNPWS